MLTSLHWLPIKQRIEYKLVTLAFHYFDGTLPPYLWHCLSSYTPRRYFRSSDELLSAPRVNLKSADARSFQYQVPCVWNSLPTQIRFQNLSRLSDPAAKRTSPALPSPETLKLTPW